MDFDVAIIGAGVVGLAIGARLSKSFNNVVIIEKNNKFGQETSSRNSEVVHSGVYYPKNSLKARLCVRGQKLLYDYCKQKNIPFRKTGKFIIAKNENEIDYLQNLLIQATQNGAIGSIISDSVLKSYEPNLEAVKALYFPESGVVDSYSLMKSLETEVFSNDGQIAYQSEVIAIRKIDNGYELTVKDEPNDLKFTASVVVNSAGLFADKVAAMIGLDLPEYEISFWKGEYFGVGNGKNKLVKGLIYPVPDGNKGLGIHTTVDINGGLKLGPSSFYVDKNNFDYKVNPANLEKFYLSAKSFLPFIEREDLHPDQAGIRPKLTKTGKEFRDFIIKNEADRGFVNFINLIGIESPGLTASLAIAEYVDRLIV